MTAETVQSASAAQIAQPIYTDAIEHRRRYEWLLQGLVGVLGPR